MGYLRSNSIICRFVGSYVIIAGFIILIRAFVTFGDFIESIQFLHTQDGAWEFLWESTYGTPPIVLIGLYCIHIVCLCTCAIMCIRAFIKTKSGTNVLCAGIIGIIGYMGQIIYALSYGRGFGLNFAEQLLIPLGVIVCGIVLRKAYAAVPSSEPSADEEKIMDHSD